MGYHRSDRSPPHGWGWGRKVVPSASRADSYSVYNVQIADGKSYSVSGKGLISIVLPSMGNAVVSTEGPPRTKASLVKGRFLQDTEHVPHFCSKTSL